MAVYEGILAGMIFKSLFYKFLLCVIGSEHWSPAMPPGNGVVGAWERL
jgi:hypothetical protein